MKIRPEVLKRFFSGKYTRKDFQEVEGYFQDETSKEELEEQLQQHWMEYHDETMTDSAYEKVLNKLQRQVHLDENKKTVRLKPLFLLQRVAAILFIPLVLSFVAYVYFNDNSNTDAYAEIYCPLGTRTKFILPDGSTGFLNNGSTLKYPVQFKGNREVELTGEAFFDVEKTGRSFHVLTKNLDVKVMGTTFNVLAYDNDQTEEVVLQTGKVDVMERGGKSLATLSPNEQLVLDIDKKTYLKNDVNASQFTAWVDGKLVFRNEGMDQVAKRLSRWYNADVSIEDERLKEYTFHATFMDEPLNQVLNLLSLTTPIKFEEVRMKKVTPDDLQPKRNITLKLKTD